MGEYLYLGGKQVAKLGVMDDFRYVRRDEGYFLAAFETEGDGYTLRHSIADGGTLWRFPFAHEDGALVDPRAVANRIDIRNMFDAPTLAAPLDLVKSFDHREKVVHMKAPGGGYGVNVWAPCPFAPNTLKTSPVTGAVSVIGERYDDKHEGRTIFACIYCERMWSFSPEDIARVIAANPQHETLTNRLKPNPMAQVTASKS